MTQSRSEKNGVETAVTLEHQLMHLQALVFHGTDDENKFNELAIFDEDPK